MIVKLNDRTYEAEEGCSLASFIEKLEIKCEGIAVAINYEVIPKNKWTDTILNDNSELMLIHAVSGG